MISMTNTSIERSSRKAPPITTRTTMSTRDQPGNPGLTSISRIRGPLRKTLEPTMKGMSLKRAGLSSRRKVELIN